MTRKYFGTDGIRGTVGQAPITPDFVLRLAHAVGRVLRKTEARPTVLIGKDTRISGYLLEPEVLILFGTVEHHIACCRITNLWSDLGQTDNVFTKVAEHLVRLS